MMKALILIIFITYLSLNCCAQLGCPVGYENGPNTIINSNFDQGIIGFYTDYKKNKSKEWFEGSIYVTDNPGSVHNNYKLCLDTAFKGLNQLLIVDGSQDRSKIVWQQKVLVQPSTEYYFSIFFATLLKTNPAQLEISINDKRLSKPFDYHYQHCKGSLFFCFWNSGQVTEADLKIRAVTTDVMGNDFVLDNIQFFSCNKKVEISPVIEKKKSDSIVYHFNISNTKSQLIKNVKALIKSAEDTFQIKSYVDSSGQFNIKLKNRPYYLSLQAQDYFKLIDTLYYSDNDTVIAKNYHLVALDSGMVFTIKNLVFDRSSSGLSEDVKRELGSLIEMLNDNPTISLEINGHTDNQGDAVKNYELSLERVTNVKNYLTENGIEKKRLNGIGFGGTKPLIGYGTDEERKANRRVEFVIVKKK
ncbi:MAG: OmpA family protein [Opitutaceae bacterium]|nr:OmpA family protein [Cytophagales bacterium]